MTRNPSTSVPQSESLPHVVSPTGIAPRTLIEQSYVAALSRRAPRCRASNSWPTRLRRRLYNVLLDVQSALIYLLTLGRKTAHEGRAREKRGRWTWRNWNRTVTLRPQSVRMPSTEKELCDLLRQANPPDGQRQTLRKVRVIGAGHAFNDSSQTEDLLLSLDAYNQVWGVIDPYEGGGLKTGEKAVRVQAGIRLRDLNAWLGEHGLALPVLGSTDAQSLGGLIATDLHGTGKDHGFLSEQVLELRIVDAMGRATTASPWQDQELFSAAIGGLGTCGVVTEVVLRCVPAFRLEKQLWIVHRQWLEQNLDEVLREHDHVSLYILAGVEVSHLYVNIWQRTQAPVSRYLRFRKARAELLDWFSAILLSDLLGWLKALDARLRWLLRLEPKEHRPREPVSKLGFGLLVLFMAIMKDGYLAYKPEPTRPGTRPFRFFDWLLGVTLKLTRNKPLVHPASTGFARKLFYRHDEIEYGVPYSQEDVSGKDKLQCLRDVMDELSKRKFVTLIEVRFTRTPSNAMLGPGVGRETCFIELAPNLSRDTDDAFMWAEQLCLRHGGQVHLGKKTFVDSQVMAWMYPGQFTRFQKVRTRQDPHGVFMNRFTQQVFGGDPRT